MANYDAQINILVSGQRNINNLANQLNQIESSITEIESRWRSASDAFQRSEIRLRAAGTRQPRGEGGRFARDPDRQARFRAYADRRRALVEQRLARISLSRTTAEAAASREQIDNNERLLRQTERRISFESRLNTANERYQYRLQKLRRGGGGRNLSQELQGQARSIQNAYNAAGGAASRNLRLIRSLSIELGVVVERQNEYNRLQALSSKGFEAGRRLQERITDIRDLGVQPEATIRGLRSQAAQVISDSRIGDQQAYSESLRSAKAAVARAERDAKQLVKSASDINEEYQKQLSLRDKIGDSALDAATKESLSVQAARALEALMENRLVLAKEITEQVERQLKLESQALEADRRINSTAQLANQQILGAENALTLAKDVEAYGRSLEKTKSVTEDILSLGEDLGRDFDQRLKKLDAEKKLRSDIASITELAAQKVTGTEESLELGKNIELYSKNLQKTQDAAEDILSIGEDLGKDFDERLKKLDAEKKLRADIQLAEQKVTGAEESFGLARDLESYSKALENTRGITEDILSLGEGLGRDFDERLKKLDAEKKLRSDIASAAELAAQKISGREESFGLARDLELYSKSLQKTQDVTEEILSLGKNLGKDFDERLKKLDSEKKLRADIASAAELAAQKISGAESSLGLSKDMEAYLNGLQKVENATKDILSLGEGLGKDFDKRLKKITTEKKLKENVAIEIASAAISEQSLINLQNKGVNVATELLSLQEALNEAKRIDGQISQETLDNLKKQITFANKKATLENRRLAGKGGGGGTGDSGVTGFSAALSPAEARKQIDQIYKDFNKAVAGNVGGAGENVTSTFASNLKKGIPDVVAASASFAGASIDAILKKLGIKSPSRVMIEIARNLVDTYVDVLEAAIPEIKRASEKAFAAPTNLDVAADRLPKGQDRIDAIAEFVASTVDPSESRGFTAFVAEELIRQKGQKLNTEKIPGLDLREAESAAVMGRYNDPNLQKLRQSYVEFYNIPSEFAPDIERASNAAGQSSESAKQLEAEVAGLVSGLEQISNLLRGTADLVKVPTASAEQVTPPAQQKTAVDLVGDYWSNAAIDAKELDSKLKQEFSGPGITNASALIDFWDTTFDEAQKIARQADEAAAEAARLQQGTSAPFQASAQKAREIDDQRRRQATFDAFAAARQQAEADAKVASEVIASQIVEPVRKSAPEGERKIQTALSSLFDRVSQALGGLGGFGGRGGGGGGGRSGGGGGAAPIGPEPIENLEQALRERRLGPIARATNDQLEELARRLQDIRNRADATGDEFRRLGRDLAVLGREQERRDPGAEFLTRSFGSRTGRAISEGLVGGAFPLLFGQGIGSSIFGGLGGAAGGFAGGGLGFGLSLLGTALGSVIDETVQKSKTLGAALNESTADIDAIVESLGEVGGPSARLIKQLEEVAGKQAALEEATARLALIVGDDGVRALQEFGDASTELGNAVSKLVTGLLAEVARLTKGPTENFAGGLTTLSLRLQATKSTDPRMQELVRRASKPKGIEDQVRTFKEIEALQRQINEQAEKELQNKINALSPINDALASEERRYEIARLGGDILKDEVMSLEKTELLSRLRQANQETLNKLLDKSISYYLATQEFKKNQIAYDRELLELTNKRAEAEKRAADEAKRKAEQAEREAKRKAEEAARAEKQMFDQFNSAVLSYNTVKLEQAKLFDEFEQIYRNEERMLIRQNKLAQENFEIEKNSLWIRYDKLEADAKSVQEQEVLRKTFETQLSILGLQRDLEKAKRNETLARLRAETLITEELQKQERESGLAQVDRSIQRIGVELGTPFQGEERERQLLSLDQQFRLEDQLAEGKRRLLEIEKGLLSTTSTTSDETIEGLQRSKLAEQAYQAELQNRLNVLFEAEKAQLRQNQLMEKYGFLSSELSTAMSAAVQSVVTGTGTVEEAFATMFQNIGRAFIDMATQMLAQKLFMTVLSAFGSPPALNFSSVNQQGAIDIGRAASFDGGGYTGYGSRTGGIDGKGGFPAILHPNETVIDHTGPALFTPSSIPNIRTEGSPMRPYGGTYPGGESGSAAPAPSGQGGQGRRYSTSAAMDRYRSSDAPAANRTVNVNYSVTEINGMRFVTEDQFRAGMNEAAKNGASMGERRTINTLKNSRSQRSKLGL